MKRDETAAGKIATARRSVVAGAALIAFGASLVLLFILDLVGIRTVEPAWLAAVVGAGTLLLGIGMLQTGRGFAKLRGAADPEQLVIAAFAEQLRPSVPRRRGSYVFGASDRCLFLVRLAVVRLGDAEVYGPSELAEFRIDHANATPVLSTPSRKLRLLAMGAPEREHLVSLLRG